MFFYRMKPSEAMTHLGIVSRETFALWCEKVQIQFYPYEFSNRKYLISGEFYAKADEVEINNIKVIHGEDWLKVYKHADDVLPYLVDRIPVNKPTKLTYKPKTKELDNFLNRLKNEKS